MLKGDRPCMCDVTLKRFRANVVAVEKQKVLFLCVVDRAF